jgi:DUF4097 and DUF4098 domain-containing protein YvlB
MRSDADRHVARITRAVATMLVMVAAVAMGAAPVSAQQDDEDWISDCRDRSSRNDRATFCDVRVERVNARGTIRVDAGTNGGVIIRGSNRRDVEVHARIQTNAESSSLARAMADEITIDARGSTIRADGPDARNRGGWSVTFVVYVPSMSDLDLVAHNGPVSISDVEGRIEANTQNGPLSLRQVAGDITARTQNGPLTIELSGATWRGRGLDAETQNGPVRLSIPENYSAQLQTGTVNGPFTTEVPLMVTSLGRRSQRIDTTLGRGGPTIRAVTTNGPVSISHR